MPFPGLQNILFLLVSPRALVRLAFGQFPLQRPSPAGGCEASGQFTPPPTVSIKKELGATFAGLLEQRMKLREFLEGYLPPEDGRTKLPTPRALMVLVRNILIARNPIYGVGEWAAGYTPDLLGIQRTELEYLNDDRAGRALEKLHQADQASLCLAVAAHAIKHFRVELDELHNDSTTISFYGAYDRQGREAPDPDRPTPIITWGHSKDHRPDLKQLLYILTVARDGAVPIHFTAASGNVTDDTTHRDTWDLLCRLAGRRDFLYVADCKLATKDNMQYIHREGGGFITVLPRTRKEDAALR